MRKKLQTICILLTSAVFSMQFVGAQTAAPTEKPKFNTWSISPSIGSSLFYGDARVYDFYPVSNEYVNERGIGFGITLNKQINEKFAIHGNLLFGNLGGAKLGLNKENKRDYTYSASNEFEGTVFEYSLLGSVNLSGMIFKTANWTKKFSINPYIGMGLVEFRAKRMLISDNNVIVSSVGYENAATDEKKETTTELVIPAGVAFNYNINKKFDIGVDLSVRSVNSDKLDALVKAGTSNDKYGYSAISVTYKFGKSEKDLKWLEPEDKLIAEGVKQDMSKYDNAIVEMNKKLDELNQKNQDLNQKLDDLNQKNEQLNKKVDEKVVKPETVKGKSTSKDGIVETNVTDFFAIEFEINSAILRKESYKDLKLLSEVLTQNPKCELKIDGHSDVSGTSAINFKLSQQRANAVRDYLVRAGVPNAVRIKTEAWGEKKPIADNDTEEGRAKNRRVELAVRCAE